MYKINSVLSENKRIRGYVELIGVKIGTYVAIVLMGLMLIISAITFIRIQNTEYQRVLGDINRVIFEDKKVWGYNVTYQTLEGEKCTSNMPIIQEYSNYNMGDNIYVYYRVDDSKELMIHPYAITFSILKYFFLLFFMIVLVNMFWLGYKSLVSDKDITAPYIEHKIHIGVLVGVWFIDSLIAYQISVRIFHMLLLNF